MVAFHWLSCEPLSLAGLLGGRGRKLLFPAGRVNLYPSASSLSVGFAIKDKWWGVSPPPASPWLHCSEGSPY